MSDHLVVGFFIVMFDGVCENTKKCPYSFIHITMQNPPWKRQTLLVQN